MHHLFTDLFGVTQRRQGPERQAVPYEPRNDGAVIMVPKDKVTGCG